MQEEDEILTGEEAIKILKIAKATLYDWVSNKRIQCEKAGSLNRFRKSEVYRVLKARKGARHED